MNKGVIAAISFISGAAASGAGVYFYMKKLCDKKIADEVAAFKKAYKTTPRYPHFDSIEGGEIGAAEEDTEDDRKASIRQKSSLSDEPYPTEKVDYHKLASNYTKSEADIAAETPSEEAEEDPADAESPREEDDLGSGDICIISQEQFDDDEGYEKIDLDWFLDGDTIVDEFGDVVEDEIREKLMGDTLESIRGELPPDKNGYLINVRNKKVMTDYSVTVYWDSYK